LPEALLTFFVGVVWREGGRGGIVPVPIVVEDVDEIGEPILHVKIFRRFIWNGAGM